jgi:hypothetical protein
LRWRRSVVRVGLAVAAAAAAIVVVVVVVLHCRDPVSLEVRVYRGCLALAPRRRRR